MNAGKKFVRTGILSACMAALMPLSVLAQSVPASQDISAESQRLEKKTEELQKTFQPQKISTEKSKETPSTNAPQVFFILKGITIQGVAIFDQKEIDAIYAPYINKYVNLGDINRIISGIKEKYKQKGYLTTTVYFPEQEIKDGVVQIAVIEGKMGELSVEGNKHFSSHYILKNIHLPHGAILDMNELNRDLLRINKTGDIVAKSVVNSGKEPGTTDVTIKVMDQRTWHWGTSFDNNGSRLLGKYRGGSYIRTTNLTGRGDSFFVNVLGNTNTLAQSVSYRTPINTKGTKIGFDYSHFTMKLGKEFRSFDITGATNQGNIILSQELYLTENMELTANAGLQIKSIKKHVNGFGVNDEQLRIPYLGADWSENDAWGNTTFSPKVEFGTESFLGASGRANNSASRVGTDGFFINYSHEFIRTHKLFWESYLKFDHQLAIASRSLPSSEQFQIGGEGSVRGYPQGDYSADLGTSFSLEWNFPMYLIPKDWRLFKDNSPLRYRITPYLFVDSGFGKLKKVLPGELKSKSLVSLGGGFRMRLYGSVYFNADWGVPVSDDPSSGSGPSTFHFSLQTEI